MKQNKGDQKTISRMNVGGGPTIQPTDRPNQTDQPPLQCIQQICKLNICWLTEEVQTTNWVFVNLDDASLANIRQIFCLHKIFEFICTGIGFHSHRFVKWPLKVNKWRMWPPGLDQASCRHHTPSNIIIIKHCRYNWLVFFSLLFWTSNCWQIWSDVFSQFDCSERNVWTFDGWLKVEKVVSQRNIWKKYSRT